MAQRDIAEAEAAMPEQDRFGVGFTGRLQPRDDLPEFGMKILFAEPVAIHMLAQRAEGQALAALAPIVHHHLVHDIGQREFDGAHGAIGHDEGAGLDPFGFQQRLRRRQAASFHHDVGAAKTTLPVLARSEEHTSELQLHSDLVCRLLLEKKKKTTELQIYSYLVCTLMLKTRLY